MLKHYEQTQENPCNTENPRPQRRTIFDSVKLMCSPSTIAHISAKHNLQSNHFGTLGLTLGSHHERQKHDLSERRETTFGVIQTLLCDTLGVPKAMHKLVKLLYSLMIKHVTHTS